MKKKALKMTIFRAFFLNVSRTNNIFKYIVFQRRQKALSWSKGLKEALRLLVSFVIC